MKTTVDIFFKTIIDIQMWTLIRKYAAYKLCFQMFERQLIFLEVVSSTGIVNPVNKLYSLAYEVQQTFFVAEKKKT